jgi:predicted Zn-dependent peptidase
MKDVVRVGYLKNGFIFYSQKGSYANLSGLGVRAGSIHNRPGKIGLQHVLEHTLSRECSDCSVIQASRVFLQFAPDAHNIRTDKVSTFYGHDILYRESHMLKMFKLISSMVKERLIDRNGVRVEKASVYQEYFLRGKDVPENEIYNMLHELLWPNHPVGQRIDCELEDLKAITREDILKFNKQYYVANNMFGIMFGAPHNKVAQRMRRAFGDLPTGSPPPIPKKYFREFRPLRGIRYLETVHRGLHQTHVGIAVPFDHRCKNDAASLDILSKLLRLRLFHRLREENQKITHGVYNVYCEISRSFLHGMLYVHFATTSKRYAELAEEIVAQEMRKLTEYLVSNEEFDAAKYAVYYPLLHAYRQIPYMVCEMVIEATCNGDEELIEMHKYPERVRNVTRSQVRNVANKYLSGGYAMAIIRPR